MASFRNYAVVTAAYWSFMVTDGALRMLVLLHFNKLGYSPAQLAILFLLYEFMGMVTNLTGGWLASRVGLNLTLYSGLALQVVALLALSLVDPSWSIPQSVAYVLLVQGLAGVAKDLCKMSSKSAIKLIVPKDEHSTLFKWVAVLTGSKNALKGLGFFLGAFLLTFAGFVHALWLMAAVLTAILIAARLSLTQTLGRTRQKTKFSQIFSKSTGINLLSAARMFLFGARDVWFVVGVPVYMYDVLRWNFMQVGTFLASWVIGYGLVQAFAPRMVKRSGDGRSSEVNSALLWVIGLTVVTLSVGLALFMQLDPRWTLLLGLSLFGVFFAVNSSVHSYLVLAFSDSEKVTLNVGFYYMANAAGRLLGTLLSGIAYQLGGIVGCLLTAAGLLVLATLFTAAIRAHILGESSKRKPTFIQEES